MNDLSKAVKVRRPSLGQIPFAVSWSGKMRDYLYGVSINTIVTASPIDAELSLSLIKISDGNFDDAEEEIISLLQRNTDLIKNDRETFISFVNATFVLQRFDIVAALLKDRYGYGRSLELAAEENGVGRHRVKWEVLKTGAHRFTFDASTLRHDNTRVDILTFQWGFPVYANYSHTLEQPVGAVVINQGDVGQTPGLAYCDSRPDYFLIPDSAFVPSGGYAHVRETAAKNEIPWNDKRSVAFWRGATG